MMLRKELEANKKSLALIKAAVELLNKCAEKVTDKQETAVSNSRFNIEYYPDYSEVMDYRKKIILMLEKFY